MSAETIAERIAAERAAFDAGWRAALAAHPPCEHVHPAIADSVASMFPSRDGPDAAAARSVARFRTWHAQARAEPKEVAAYADAA